MLFFEMLFMREVRISFMRRFQDRRSPVIEGILVLMHSPRWEKTLLLILHVSNFLKLQNHKVDKLMIEVNGFVCEI